jgi:hypothetical protein
MNDRGTATRSKEHNTCCSAKQCMLAVYRNDLKRLLLNAKMIHGTDKKRNIWCDHSISSTETSYIRCNMYLND